MILKKMKIFIIALVLMVATLSSLPLTKANAATEKYVGKNLHVKAGDILITSKKTTRYHTGHSAIVTDDLRVVHIPAPGTHPQILSLSKWEKSYKIRKVVRLKSTATAKAAGKWAREYQKKYSKANYTIWSSIYGNFNNTYCSKLVWQSYYYGGKIDILQHYNGRDVIPTVGKILPYDFEHITYFDHKNY